MMPGYPRSLADLRGFRHCNVNPTETFVGARTLAASLLTLPTHGLMSERSIADVPYIFGKHASCLIPERDAAAIARRLQRYADEPETVGTDGMALRAHMTAAFDIRIRAAALADLYDAL